MTMNDIVAFVEKAMENNLKICTWKSDMIKVYQDSYENIGFWYSKQQKSIKIEVCHLDMYEIHNLNDLDTSTFEYLCARVRNYSQNKTLEYFNNFFKDEESKFKDINDLDDKED